MPTHASSENERFRLRLFILILLFVWVVLYQLGPGRAQFQAVWISDHSWLFHALESMFDVALPIFAIAFGFTVVLLKADDIKAWLLLALVLSFVENTRMGPDITAHARWFRIAAATYQSLGEHLWPLFFFLFLVYFPVRASIDVRWPWLKGLIAVPFFSQALLYVAQDLKIRGARHFLQSELTLAAVIDYGLMACALALLSARYFIAQTADQRRRLRLFYFGILISLVPALAMAYTRDLLHKHDLSFAPAWTVLVAFGLLTLFPAVLAYVILVQRAMDVRVVIRQGIR